MSVTAGYVNKEIRGNETMPTQDTGSFYISGFILLVDIVMQYLLLWKILIQSLKKWSRVSSSLINWVTACQQCAQCCHCGLKLHFSNTTE